ncbi:MAG: hypothetical protein LBK99_25555 [Opitutaceae bacterium]|jgi:integrase|nr:hypothetical protein [Opitutaceae bacterium]
MKIGGPFLDVSRKKNPKKWYLSYFVPKLDPQGAPILKNGRAVLERKRPYYETKDAAQEDKPRILAQYGTGGNSTKGGGVLSRAQTEEYEQAKTFVSEVPLPEVARFYRLHHPLASVARISSLIPQFTSVIEARVGKTRHWEDLKNRLATWARVFGERIPATITRDEVMTWLLGMGKSGRTVLNQKRAIVNFFNWLVEKRHLETNPLAGIKRRQLPKIVHKEIEFLSIPEVSRYLRAAERYDPELVAHEVIQLFAGVRADDEMADFDGKWVLPQTREVVIPAEVGKMGRREVIDGLEDCFWSWWSKYGREGILRPVNYEPRWKRIRILAQIGDRAKADTLAALPIKTLMAQELAVSKLAAWPWNARRRTFCTYHVAKYQSADKTALILRHKGEASTLHNSYRGLGVTQELGAEFFLMLPRPVDSPISPVVVRRGIVKIQAERKASILPCER